MAVNFKTDNAQVLLDSFDARIDQSEVKGKSDGIRPQFLTAWRSGGRLNG
jgi:hypothetical protein